MRMWMIPPTLLCKKHLLGEHGEIHKFRPSFVKGVSIKGRLGQIEPISMGVRHDALAEEMLRRKMNHQSPYEQPDLSHYDLTGHLVDTDKAVLDLCQRCEECRKRVVAANFAPHLNISLTTNIEAAIVAA